MVDVRMKTFATVYIPIYHVDAAALHSHLPPRHKKWGAANFLPHKTDPMDFAFEVGRGFRLLKAQIATELIRKFPGEWQDNFGVYLKPSNCTWLQCKLGCLRTPPSKSPDTATFRQLQNIDRLSQEMQQNHQAEQTNTDTNFRLIRIMIFCAVLQAHVNVADLREIPGLPSYSIRPPFRDPVDFETQASAEDMEDVDHMEEQQDKI
ncbi:unnamed protein product [Phytophthora fragariaefolia]|uniref:Unnamed protein product n=1 Tax=Phytophthora fragariaefolia TaxID=1490495 RepID=A0A9W6YMP7_9STRA|nr:unnamed protein product [Phytophthora fragariaefolia]